MKLGLKLISLIIIALGLYLLISHDEAKVPEIKADVKDVGASPALTAQPSAHIENFFDPDKVTKLVWTDSGASITLTKTGDKWTATPPTAVDPWQVRRRLEIISHFAPVEISASSVTGHVLIIAADKTLEGSFDQNHFFWTSKDIQGQGIDFTSQSLGGDAFDEGLLGFRPHEAELCNPKQVTALEIQGSWSIQKSKSGWTTKFNDKAEPARTGAVNEFLTHVCKVKVDRFYRPLAHDQPVREAVVIHLASRPEKVMKSGSEYAFKDLTFSSEILDGLLKTDWDDVRDPTSEDGKVALDPKLDMKTRVMAIRKVRDNPSAAALPWLKELVFENTELDVYRYEAVDALASVGTKQAYGLIAERLAQVGRSGFQLRLARALAAGMGRPFMSDEKTPDSERQSEITELIEAYKKNPPGK
jgi:hypothetical protein